MTATRTTSPTPESVERELAALGEAPVSAEELALLGSNSDPLDPLDQRDPFASVARLAELAEPLEFDDLSQLETHRAWRTIEARTSEQRTTKPTAARPHGSESGPHGDPSSHPHGGGPRRWLFAAVGVAAAAVILIIVVPRDLTTPDPITAETHVDPQAVAELGAQARASLKVLDDGTSDSQRAAKLADEYRARLEEQGG